MKWYINKLAELENVAPIISVCGDDCAVCPRYLAQTEDELRETAIFWYKAGWRDRVVSNEEIRCTGCGCRPTCSFMLLPCVKEHGVEKCSGCGEYPCGKIHATLASSKSKKQQCRAACESDEEFAMFVRAFYEKEKHL